ncbi:SDR family NAD(P)-dependent oxidoreductase [Rhodobacteraceae bacterium W635]|uniref:SDR family NAD(P)-dependent oxidoreductase n=1 Tax=Nioella halotolerans TaxID=2303578 RepID=UPI000E3C37E6|nr:SDR family NAD(P)-dependent oxidoreductase [Rhodobacteraceae bacterium W635]
MFQGKTYWLIGASEGLGRDLAGLLAEEGAQLVLSARNAERLDSLAASLPGARALQMDVTDDASVRAAASGLGEIDGVIYCAGAYEPMSAEAWDVDEALKVSEVNYTGALRSLGHVVPGMAARGAGHVVLIGSLAGFRGLPGAIGYGASKSALMHLAENLYMDLSRKGVTVQQVNPGFIKTRLTEKNSFDMPFIITSEDAARRTLGAMKSGRFATSYPWQMAAFFRLGAVLPIRLFRRLMGA